MAKSTTGSAGVSPENGSPSAQNSASIEQKIAFLENQITELNTAKNTAEAKVVELNAAKDIAEAKVAVLESEASVSKSTIDSLNQQINIQDEAIEKLSSELRGYVQGSILIVSDTGKDVAVIPSNPVIVNDVAYVFQKPAFVLGGVMYTANEAALDEDLLKRVVEIEGQTILREQV